MKKFAPAFLDRMFYLVMSRFDSAEIACGDMSYGSSASGTPFFVPFGGPGAASVPTSPEGFPGLFFGQIPHPIAQIQSLFERFLKSFFNSQGVLAGLIGNFLLPKHVKPEQNLNRS